MSSFRSQGEILFHRHILQFAVFLVLSQFGVVAHAFFDGLQALNMSHDGIKLVFSSAESGQFFGIARGFRQAEKSRDFLVFAFDFLEKILHIG